MSALGQKQTAIQRCTSVQRRPSLIVISYLAVWIGAAVGGVTGGVIGYLIRPDG
jgi:hypothetical protein